MNIRCRFRIDLVVLKHTSTQNGMKTPTPRISPMTTRAGTNEAKADTFGIAPTNRILDNKHLIRTSLCSKVTTIFILLLILLGGDLEINPGPVRPKFPCHICGKAVKWGQRAIQCDCCDDWYHKDCMLMRTAHFDILELNESLSWRCDSCGYSNISLNSTPASTQQDTEMLSIYSRISCSSISDASFHGSTMDSPIAVSTPTRKPKPPKPQFNQLKIAVANCQNARSKSFLMCAMLESLSPDVFIATESHLNPEIGTPEVLPVNYQQYCFRRDRSPPDGHGGVFVALKENISARHATEYEKDDCELTWAEVQSKDSNLIYIGAYYRPPRSKEISLSQLESSIDSIKKDHPNAILIVGGDFNLPSIDWVTVATKPGATPKTQHDQLVDMMFDHNMQQMNLEPTRGKNILDLIFTSSPGLVTNTQTAPGISDHEHMIVMNMLPKARISKKKPRSVYLYNKANWDQMRKDLEDGQFSFFSKLPSEDTVEENWRHLHSMMIETIKNNVPEKKVSTRYNLPYLTRKTIRQIRRKKRTYHKAKRTGDQRDWDKFHQQRRECQRATKRDYWQYINRLIDPDTDTTNKNLWSYLKTKRQDSFGVAPLKEHGKIHTTAADKADILNQQFVSVFTKPTRAHNCPLLTPNHHPAMENIKITNNGVKKLLCNLKVNKASGPDQIPARIMRECASEISPMLTFIFQQSLETGEVPTQWREANVVPVFKKGDRSKPANYRPVSLTVIACKLLEHIIVTNIMTHMDNHHLFTDSQHGFRQKRSCETQLLITTSDLANALNDKKQTDMAILDFSKAFDKVSHRLLVKKLEHYGICGKTKTWIQSFLTHRKQRVVVDGEKSSDAEVLSGVPQGSVLGPALFLIFINDIADKIKSSIRLFADDCLIYKTIEKKEDQKVLQKDLDELYNWSQKWAMSFNVSKCFVMRVTNARKNIHGGNYTMGGETMTITDTSPYLGVTLSKDLKWNNHVDNIVRKANKVLGLLRRNLYRAPQKIKETAYKTLVQPRLEYCSPIWSPHQLYLKEKVEAVQKRAARFVLRRPHLKSQPDSVTEMLHELKWQSMEERRNQQSIVLMWKILKGQVAVPASYHPQQSSCNYNTRDSNEHTLTRQQPRIDAMKYSFFPRTIPLWNALPYETAAVPSVEMLKAKLTKQP